MDIIVSWGKCKNKSMQLILNQVQRIKKNAEYKLIKIVKK